MTTNSKQRTTRRERRVAKKFEELAKIGEAELAEKLNAVREEQKEESAKVLGAVDATKGAVDNGFTKMGDKMQGGFDQMQGGFDRLNDNLKVVYADKFDFIQKQKEDEQEIKRLRANDQKSAKKANRLEKEKMEAQRRAEEADEKKRDLEEKLKIAEEEAAASKEKFDKWKSCQKQIRRIEGDESLSSEDKDAKINAVNKDMASLGLLSPEAKKPATLSKDDHNRRVVKGNEKEKTRMTMANYKRRNPRPTF